MKTIESLRVEYGLRGYNGVRIGCLTGYGYSGQCTRKRHFFKHQMEDDEVQTVAAIMSRLKKEESWLIKE